MAVVQISWKDNADNETAFKIYKGTTTPLSGASTQIAQVDLVGSAWVASEINNGAPNVTLTSTNTGDSATQNEVFVITYEESITGDYYYGVSASNSVGDSDVVTTSPALAVS